MMECKKWTYSEYTLFWLTKKKKCINVGAGHGLIRCSGNIVPFENIFPKNKKLYALMSTFGDAE